MLERLMKLTTAMHDMLDHNGDISAQAYAVQPLDVTPAAALPM